MVFLSWRRNEEMGSYRKKGVSNEKSGLQIKKKVNVWTDLKSKRKDYCGLGEEIFVLESFDVICFVIEVFY